MNRKDFRPNENFSSNISDKDRKVIERNRMERGHTEKIPKASEQPYSFGSGTGGGKEKQTQSIKAFINGESKGHKGDIISSDGKKLYSYDTVIATKQSDGTVILNKTKYSSTTNRQQIETESLLKANHVKYDVTGGKDRGYEGEDFSKDNQPESYPQPLHNGKDTKIIEEKDGYYVGDKYTTTRYPKTENGKERAERHVENNKKIDEKQDRDYSKEYSGEYTGKKEKTEQDLRNIEYDDYTTRHNADSKYVKIKNGYGDYEYVKYSTIVNKKGESKKPIERNASGYPVLYEQKGDGYTGIYHNPNKPIIEQRDYSKEYSGEYTGKKEKTEIAKEYKQKYHVEVSPYGSSGNKKYSVLEYENGKPTGNRKEFTSETKAKSYAKELKDNHNKSKLKDSQIFSSQTNTPHKTKKFSYGKTDRGEKILAQGQNDDLINDTGTRRTWRSRSDNSLSYETLHNGKWESD